MQIAVGSANQRNVVDGIFGLRTIRLLFVDAMTMLIACPHNRSHYMAARSLLGGTVQLVTDVYDEYNIIDCCML